MPTRHAAAISRPIHVDCYPDRVVLVPDGRSGEPRVVFCDNGGQRDADKLVAAVWEIMDTWGMAGREMYWRPDAQLLRRPRRPNRACSTSPAPWKAAGW